MTAHETAGSSGRAEGKAENKSESAASKPGDDYPIIFFDGVCHLCDRSVRFILQRDRKARFHFAPLQSALGKDLLEKHGLSSSPETSPESIVLIEEGKVHTKSSAALRIAGRLTFPWKAGVLFLLVPKILRDAVYDVIARNRYRWFGKRETCLVSEPKWKSRFHE